MIKRTTAVLLWFVFSTIVLLSCSKSKNENNCISYSNLSVTKVEGPNTGSVNQDIDLTVTYSIGNGCGQFDHFEKTVNGNTTTVNVVGKYTGCICTAIFQIVQATYHFKATAAGTYYLKFFQDSNTPLMDTIVVQ